MIKVMIVDDHPVVRRGMMDLLASERDFAKPLLAVNGEEAVRLLEESKVDVVVMDVRMPKLDGFGAAELVRRRGAKPGILLLAGMPLKDEEDRARSLGVEGYLPKSIDQDELVDAIRKIAAGETVFRSADFTPIPAILSKRELEVLKYLAIGKTREEIAIILGLSIHTVKTHVQTIQRRLNACNTTSAVARAYELGVLVK